MSAAVEESKKSSIGKSISKASQMMIGVGPPLYKQLKFAILEGNEDKAVGIYNGKEMGKALKDTLHPSKPFPSKKDPNGETPLHLSAKFALPVLFGMFLQYGGRPDIVNSRRESCLHTVCTESNHPARRVEVLEQAVKWRSVNPSTNKAVAVAIDGTDIEGNTAMHLAACNGLLLILEKLIAYHASSYVLNHNNLTASEHADVSGRANIGTMIELAGIFAPSAIGGRITDAMNQYRTVLREYRNSGLGVLILDSHSLTASGLMKFISRTIAMVADALQETPARAEVMLMHYRWDARLLIADYQRNTGSVVRAVRIQHRGQGRGGEDNSQALVVKNESENAVVLHDSEVNVPVGVTISDVCLDPSYQEMGPFTVMRGGKKVPYTIRSVQGKTVVVPFDFDPSAKGNTIDDQKVSANSHLKPEATTSCPMCGEQMLEAAAVQHYIAGTLVQPKHRELQCGSGHKYCFSCWAGYLQAQAASREGLHALQCPSKDCGEALDLQWAPVLLKSPDLVNRVFAQRQRQVTDKLKLHWCSVPKCGLIVHVHASEDEESRGSDCSAGSIPLCGLCANGHGVCLCCGSEPHAPCKCDELTKWQDLVREVARTPQAQERANPAHILQHAPHHKNCTQCGVSNGKEHGSNHIRCTGCFREFCWICLRDWAAHTAESKDRHSRDSGDEEVLPFQCNTWFDPVQSSGLSERHAIFLRYFARYQAHMESFNLESAMFKSCVDRVVQGLKATHDGELQWLLGEGVFNPYDPADSARVLNDKDVTLSDSYLPREKVVEFLVEGFEELEKCRTLLRWSYPFSMFQFEDEFRKAFGPNGMVLILGDRSEYRGEFAAAQNALERQTEFLSDILAHRRLRGSREDIIEACMAAKSHRAVLESLVVSHNPTFGGSQSLDFSRSQSVDDRRSSLRGLYLGSPVAGSAGPVKMKTVSEDQGESVYHSSAGQTKSSAGVTASSAGLAKKSSFSTAMEIDVGVQKTRPISASQAAPPPPVPPVVQAPVAPKAPETPKMQPPKAPIIQEPESESEGEYGYNSADEEGLQVCTDVAMMKMDASPRQQSSKGAHNNTTTTTAGMTVDAERSTQQATETVTTLKTTKVIAVQNSPLSGKTNAGSGNSLMSDLTTPDFNNSGNSLMFARVPKLTAETSPKPPQLIQQATSNTTAGRTLIKTSSMTSKQLSKEVSKLFVKQIVEHISEEESKIVYMLMSKHKITREKAVRKFLEEHDERLYNPKAVYLFPGEEYIPEEEDDDSEEERRKEAMFGRVEYNQKTRVDTDSISEASPATIEQRIIGAKKDPDQEALEHALLLSAQEQEFGVNMYDSLTAADQLVLQEYISQGFTREEGALIIFEEKFGKTKNAQNSVVIPAMPTLRAVHASTHSHSGTDRSSAIYGSDEEDGEEVEDLIRRGYTREQAIAVIEGHREKARRAAMTQHPSDPTFYHPHPQEDRFNLTEREEREVEQLMSRQKCSRRVAVESVVQTRTTTASSASVTSHNSWEGSHSSNYSESAEVRQLMDRGYSREQALQAIRNKSTSMNAASASSNNSVSSNGHRPSYSSTTGESYSEEAEIAKHLSKGYTLEQAREMVRRSREGSQRTSANLTVEAAAVSVAPGHRRSASASSHHGSLPANMDAETTELVRQQIEDYGTNMFLAITREDDAEVERLMADGYQYNEALLEIFNYTHAPRPVGRQYTAYPPQAPYPQPVANQSFYQQPQYQIPPPPQPYYAQQPAGYMHSQSYYVPPQPQQVPVMHTQSFYQAPGPSYMVHSNGQMQQIPATDEELYPTHFAPGAKPALGRKPSSRDHSGGGGSTGKPPVINGNQTLLEQKRQGAAKAAKEKEREKEQESQEGKDGGLRKKSSFFGGMAGATRKSAHTEDDLMARAHHMSDVDHGRKEPSDKGKVPKLKYSDADVNKIMKMGFTRDQAVQALVQSHHNVDEAVHMLTDN